MRSLLFLLLALLLTLTACGGGGGDGGFNSNNGSGGDDGLTGAQVNITLTTNGGVPADGESQATIVVEVLSDNGQPVKEQSLRFSFAAAEETAFGTLNVTTAQTDADGKATAIFTASKTRGTANIRVTIGTEIDETVTVTTQEAVTDTIKLTESTIGNDVVADVELTALSNLGNPLPLADAAVEFTAISGVVGGSVCANPANVSLAPAGTLTDSSGRAQTVVSASEDGDYCVQATTTNGKRAEILLTLTAKDPGANATLNIATNTRGGVFADGQSQATFTATLKNSQGDPLANQNINVTFAQPDQEAFGALSNILITTDAAGQGTVNFTASSRPGSVSIRFAFGEQLVQTVNLTTTAPVANAVALTQATINGDVVLSADITSLSNLGNALALADANVNFTAIPGVVGGSVCGDPANVSLAPTSTLTNGNGRAQSVVSATEDGDYCVQASTANGKRAEILVKLTAKDPIANATLDISTNTRGGVFADGQSQATFTATLKNSQGAGLANENISVSFAQPDQEAFGDLSDILITTNASGQATVNFTASRTPGTVSIRFAFGEQLAQTVNLTTSEPEASQVTLVPGAVINNSVVLTATAVSTSNLGTDIALPDKTITFSAISGVLNGSLCQTPGNATLTPATLTTDDNGEAQTVLSATQAGDYCIQATAIQATGENGEFVKLLVPVNQSATPITLDIFLNKPTLKTGADDRVQATVLVRNSDTNNIIPNQPVTFSVTSGELVVLRGTTNESGTALAEITSATNLANRDITLTASANNQTATLTFPVEGTRLELRNNVDLLAVGASKDLEFDLFDGSDDSIPSVSVTAVSSDTNVLTVSPATQVVSLQGAGKATVTGVGAGGATVTLEAVGLNARITTSPIVVDNTAFDITISEDLDQNGALDPGEDANRNGQLDAGSTLDLIIGTRAPLTVLWTKGGVAVNGATVTLNTTRGEFTDGAGIGLGNTQVLITDATGQVSTFLRASSAGQATISATGSSTTQGSASTTATVLFTSNNPQVLALTADPDTVQVGGEASNIRALVTDLNNNAVANFTVSFNLFDPSGGTLSASTAVTDAQGLATVIYRSGSQGSAKDGVAITANVLNTSGNPIAGLNKTINLSVADPEVFVRLGTSRDILAPTLTTYADPWSVLVTDAVGGGLADQTVVLRVTPTRYFKGYWVKDPPPPESFKLWVPQVTAICDSEDLDRDGVLDPGEDANGDGVLTPGNAASVPPTVTTQDGTGSLAIGFEEFNVTYSKNRGAWTEVNLEASTSVSGSESRTFQVFILNVSVEDVTEENAPPPENPYGSSPDCTCSLADEALAVQGGAVFRTECIPCTVTTTTPVLDVNGNPVLDANGDPVTVTVPANPACP